MAVIECNNVTIKYITGDLKAIGLKEYVVRKLTGNYHVTEFYADKNVTFSLEKGDMLGLVGANGAGKSTLLKAVTGIMLPETGTIKTKGNIAALLELASGFDNEMTVRENAYLRGAMLGYTREFMDSKYQEIIEFAELENFQDYMFKQLSSGMKSRLAFSIACLVNPDIIILDEVLSVGDGAFRKKSGDRMKKILASGVTGILVTHSVNQVRELCNKILWLDHGNQIIFSDDVLRICDAYGEFLMTKQLPTNDEEMEELAIKHKIRRQMAEEEKNKTEAQKLESILEQGTKSSAIDAALNILLKNKPELINKDMLGEGDVEFYEDVDL